MEIEVHLFSRWKNWRPQPLVIIFKFSSGIFRTLLLTRISKFHSSIWMVIQFLQRWQYANVKLLSLMISRCNRALRSNCRILSIKANAGLLLGEISKLQSLIGVDVVVVSESLRGTAIGNMFYMYRERFTLVIELFAFYNIAFSFF